MSACNTFQLTVNGDRCAAPARYVRRGVASEPSPSPDMTRHASASHGFLPLRRPRPVPWRCPLWRLMRVVGRLVGSFPAGSTRLRGPRYDPRAITISCPYDRRRAGAETRVAANSSASTGAARFACCGGQCVRRFSPATLTGSDATGSARLSEALRHGTLLPSTTPTASTPTAPVLSEVVKIRIRSHGFLLMLSKATRRKDATWRHLRLSHAPNSVFR
jgi:hypothetical protein